MASMIETPDRLVDEDRDRDRGETIRRRDSVATRQALLDAAREFFGTKGYDATSLREIGERAGVDASLIARYFGNKMALYSATIEADGVGNLLAADPRDLTGLTRRLLERVDANGLGPIMRALIETDVDSEMRRVAEDHMQRRVLAPLIDQMRRDGQDAPELRAELILASLIGIMTVRSTGALTRTAAASHEAIADIMVTALQEIAGMSSAGGSTIDSTP